MCTNTCLDAGIQPMRFRNVADTLSLGRGYSFIAARKARTNCLDGVGYHRGCRQAGSRPR
ncbi:hypothetical protein M3J09_008343 [Ascochyta lentis]